MQEADPSSISKTELDDIQKEQDNTCHGLQLSIEQVVLSLHLQKFGAYSSQQPEYQLLPWIYEALGLAIGSFNMQDLCT